MMFSTSPALVSELKNRALKAAQHWCDQRFAGCFDFNDEEGISVLAVLFLEVAMVWNPLLGDEPLMAVRELGNKLDDFQLYPTGGGGIILRSRFRDIEISNRNLDYAGLYRLLRLWVQQYVEYLENATDWMSHLEEKAPTPDSDSLLYCVEAMEDAPRSKIHLVPDLVSWKQFIG